MANVIPLPKTKPMISVETDIRPIFLTPIVVQALYDLSRNKLQQKVSQRFLVNRGVPYDILKV